VLFNLFKHILRTGFRVAVRFNVWFICCGNKKTVLNRLIIEPICPVGLTKPIDWFWLRSCVKSPVRTALTVTSRSCLDSWVDRAFDSEVAEVECLAVLALSLFDEIGDEVIVIKSFVVVQASLHRCGWLHETFLIIKRGNLLFGWEILIIFLDGALLNV